MTGSAYRTQSPDTSVEAERLLFDSYRQMTPGQKLDMVRQLSMAASEFAAAGLKRRHPDASPHEIEMRLAAIRLGPEVMRDAFGWREPSAPDSR